MRLRVLPLPCQGPALHPSDGCMSLSGGRSSSGLPCSERKEDHKGTSVHAHLHGAKPEQAPSQGCRSPSAARRLLLDRVGIVGCLVHIRLPVLQGLPPYAVANGTMCFGALKAPLHLCWQRLHPEEHE